MPKKPAKGSDEALVAQIQSAAIELRSVEDLIPYARNSRTHSDAQIDKLCASIREFGFTNSVLIDPKSEIIAGHARVMAAQKIGLAKVPCVVLAHLSAAQKRAYVIADNRMALDAGWDINILISEIDSLRLDDFDLGLTGFTQEEITQLSGTATADDDDPPKDIDYKTMYQVVVDCADETEQESVFNQLNDLGLKCRVLSM